MIYVAVSATNQCGYCIASHTASARKAGMSDAMFAELMAVVGMANETNRLASGYQVEIDEKLPDVAELVRGVRAGSCGADLASVGSARRDGRTSSFRI